jgi:hypothetical protein
MPLDISERDGEASVAQGSHLRHGTTVEGQSKGARGCGYAGVPAL